MPDPRALRLLIVCSVLPYPATAGDPVRVLGLLRHLVPEMTSMGWQVEILAVERPDGKAEDVTSLRRILRCGVVTVPYRNPLGNSRLARGVRWLKGWPLGVPGWIQERSPGKLRQELAVRDCDVAIFFGEASARWVNVLRSRPKRVRVWDKSNVLAASADGTWRGHPVRQFLAVRSSLAFESSRMQSFDRVLVTSTAEAQRLTEFFGRQPDGIIPSGIDVSDFEPSTVSQRQGKTLGWLGSFSYSSNVDGLVSFLQNDWSSLRAQGWSLDITGSGVIPPIVHQVVAKHSGIRLNGFVADIGAWMTGLHGAVVPLYSGAGVKLKTLTFMAAGVPVIGTEEAFEGVAVEHGVNALLVGGGRSFAQCAELLAAPSSAEAIAREGLRTVSLFDNRTLALKYSSLIVSWAGNAI